MRDNFTYRIVSEKGTLDFSLSYDGIMKKYNRYARDLEDGYSEKISVVWVDPATGCEGILFTKTR